MNEAELVAEHERNHARRQCQARRERAALAIFRTLAQADATDQTKRTAELCVPTDWKALACQAVEAAEALEAALYPDVPPLPPYQA